MVNGKLKDIIYKKLCEDLSHVEIINYKGEIWFIDRDNKYWYFIYDKNNGELWWRYSFFTSFCLLFSLPVIEFNLLISYWVEDVLKSKVTTTEGGSDNVGNEVEEVLSYRVNTTRTRNKGPWERVEEVLNCKVTTTI